MASRRVVLFNVLSDISDAAFIAILLALGKPMSQISTIHPDLKYIKSFPRLVYVIIWGIATYLYCRTRWRVSYVTSDDVTCMNCQKPGRVARNCHTTAQPRLGPVTFAALAVGRRACHTSTTDLKQRKAGTHNSLPGINSTPTETTLNS